MAVKFSQFVVETDKANVNYLVGWDGTENVQITPADLLGSYPSGSGAAGQVTFFSATSTVTGDNDFYWNNTNKRLGIGTTSPSSRVTISGTNNLTSEITLINTNPSTDNDWSITPYYNDQSLRFRTNGGATTVMTLEDNGNVGIGTASPSAKLHVDGTLIATGISQLGSGGANVYLTSSSAGNVGIGTSSPNVKLEINGGADAVARITGTTTAARFDYKTNSNHMFWQLIESDGRFRLYDQTNTSERLTITSAGNVGIGTSSPDKKLHIVDTNAGALTYPLRLQNSGTTVGTDVGLIFTTKTSGGGSASSVIRSESEDTSGNNSLVFTTPSGGSTAERMRINSDGNVGIGTTSPTAKLQITTNFSNSPQPLIFLSNNGLNLPGGGSEIIFGTSVSATTSLYNAKIQAVRSALDNGSSDLFFQTTHVSTSASPITKMTIKSDGNVGIGTSSPSEKLQINNGRLRFLESGQRQYNIGIVSGTSDFAITDATFSSERMRITGGGNVGIGTISPSKKLEVVSNTTYDGIQISGSSIPTLGIIDTTNNAKLVAYVRDSDATIGMETNHPLTINTNNIERMRIDSSGNVGIGTTSPTAKLQIESTSGNALSFTHSGQETYNISHGTSGLYLKLGSTLLTGWTQNHDFTIWDTSGNNYVMFDGSTQNVGIGTTSPQAKLEITTLRESGIRLSSSDISAAADELLSGIDFYSPDTGNEGIKASIKVNYADTAANSYMTFSTGANTERMRIDSSGNILFGTTGTPNGTSVYGSAFLSTSNERMALVQASNTTSLATMQTYYNPNGAVGSIKTTGSATQFNTSSDYRLKKDLKDFNGLDKVSKIPVYDFKWKVDDSRSYGVMAHELQDVLPDAVSGEKDAEEMQGVDYSKIVPLLIKSIQELSAEVKELKSKI